RLNYKVSMKTSTGGPSPSDVRGPSASAEPGRDESGRRPEVRLHDLQAMSMTELIALARREGAEDIAGRKRQEIIFSLIREKAKRGEVLVDEGVLEVLPEGFGFLRSMRYDYSPSPDDVYVSAAQTRRFGLKTGDVVRGE